MVGIYDFRGIEGVGIARDRPEFLGYPLLTEEWTSNLAGAFIGCIRTRAL